MLAPRKTLWSTPPEVVPILMDWITVKSHDVILDVGCGDAKILLLWAMQVYASLKSQSSTSLHEQHPRMSNTQPSKPIQFLGIEIDEQRAAQANENVQRAYDAGWLDRHVITIDIQCGNALEARDCFRDATIIFMYLIPRGLKRIKPLLRLEHEHPNPRRAVVQVVTYMAPLPDETHVSKRSCIVEHQPGAAWPLYLYHLSIHRESHVGHIIYPHPLDAESSTFP